MNQRALRRTGVIGAATMLVAALVGAPSAASAKTTDPWWFSALHLADAHKKTTGKGVKIAVIDTGLDPTVPDLKGADIEFGAACAPDDAKSRPRIHDFEANHGTAMTTMIVGQGKGNGPGGSGITGVAPDATVRFYNAVPDPRQTSKKCREAQTRTLFDKAVDDGVDIINFSVTDVFGMEAVIKRAIDAGVVVVAGGGEPDEGISSPASIPGVVSVLSLDESARAWKHNPHMDIPLSQLHDGWKQGYPVISAPGVKVPVGAMDTSGGWVSAFARTGTSDSTAMVSGLLALLKSAYPKATGNQLIQHLIHYPASEKLAWDQWYGFGIASITLMLRHDPTKWPDVNPLLNGPKQAIADFPAGSDTAKAQTPKPDKSPASATTTDKQDSGIPAWLWPTGAVALILMSGAAVVTMRRQRTNVSDTTPSDTPEGARS